MNGGDPTWLKLALGFVPVLTALLAGTFAAMNTLNRRIERFKFLNEVRKDYPAQLDPDKALEATVIRELCSIDRITRPDNRHTRTLIYIGFVAMLFFSTMVFVEVNRQHTSNFSLTSPLLWACVGSAASIFLLLFSFAMWFSDQDEADKAAEAAIKSLRAK